MSRRHFIDFAADIGLGAQAASRAIDIALAATASVVDDWSAGCLPFDDRTVSDVTRTLRRRRRDLAPE